MEKIGLAGFLHDVSDEAIASMGEREVSIIANFEKEIVLTMDRIILKKVCMGLLKNAIENTPDEGKIEINAKTQDDEVLIDFYDYGVGVTPQNQKLIF